jgi:AbrB family looped-hinge helix DNA binding protein
MEDRMSIVTVSPKFQIVIPKEIRRRLGLRAGQKADVFGDAERGRIEIVPRRPMKEFRGLLKGMSPAFDRDREWGKERV